LKGGKPLMGTIGSPMTQQLTALGITVPDLFSWYDRHYSPGIAAGQVTASAPKNLLNKITTSKTAGIPTWILLPGIGFLAYKFLRNEEKKKDQAQAIR